MEQSKADFIFKFLFQRIRLKYLAV